MSENSDSSPEVHEVRDRDRDASAVWLHLVGAAVAGTGGLSEISAGAGVPGRHEHEPRRAGERDDVYRPVPGLQQYPRVRK